MFCKLFELGCSLKSIFPLPPHGHPEDVHYSVLRNVSHHPTRPNTRKLKFCIDTMLLLYNFAFFGECCRVQACADECWSLINRYF